MDVFSDATLRQGAVPGNYDVRLSLSLTGALAVIVLDFYRERPALRFVTGLMGIPLLLGGAWAFLSVGFEWWDTLAFGMLLAGAAVFSSDRFNVYMADGGPAATDDAGATVGPAAPDGALATARTEAMEGRDRALGEARSRFRWGLFALVSAAGLGLAGTLTFLTGAGDSTWRSGLAVAAGLVLGLVSAVLLHASERARDAELLYAGQLRRVQELEAALRLAVHDTGADGRAEERARVLGVLLGAASREEEVDPSAPGPR
ncbi:MAG: hypothetical protein AMXMBFR53_07230 [Gemmatimonadota bacterium]